MQPLSHSLSHERAAPRRRRPHSSSRRTPPSISICAARSPVARRPQYPLASPPRLHHDDFEHPRSTHTPPRLVLSFAPQHCTANPAPHAAWPHTASFRRILALQLYMHRLRSPPTLSTAAKCDLHPSPLHSPATTVANSPQPTLVLGRAPTDAPCPHCTPSCTDPIRHCHQATPQPPNRSSPLCKHPFTEPAKSSDQAPTFATSTIQHRDYKPTTQRQSRPSPTRNHPSPVRPPSMCAAPLHFDGRPSVRPFRRTYGPTSHPGGLDPGRQPPSRHRTLQAIHHSRHYATISRRSRPLPSLFSVFIFLFIIKF